MLVLLIGKNNNELAYWKDILSKWNTGLGRATILTNQRRDIFANGTMDTNAIHSNMLDVGSATVSISFNTCCLSISIEVTG